MRRSIVGRKHLVLPQRFQSHFVNLLRKWHLYLMQSTGGTDVVSVYLDVGSVEFASEYENEPMSEMSGRAFGILELSYRVEPSTERKVCQYWHSSEQIERSGYIPQNQ